MGYDRIGLTPENALGFHRKGHTRLSKAKALRASDFIALIENSVTATYFTRDVTTFYEIGTAQKVRRANWYTTHSRREHSAMIAMYASPVELNQW